jgi:hypothetical protein
MGYSTDLAPAARCAGEAEDAGTLQGKGGLFIFVHGASHDTEGMVRGCCGSCTPRSYDVYSMFSRGRLRIGRFADFLEWISGDVCIVGLLICSLSCA